MHFEIKQLRDSPKDYARKGEVGMSIMKKGMALILSVTLVITMMPASVAYVFAADNTTSGKSAGGDAFAAIGIDTSVAPDGYDADSIDNPYGRDTVKVNTVSELYTVGLSRDVSNINSGSIKGADAADASAEGKISTKDGKANASLGTTLYGDGSGLKSITDALGKKSPGTVSSGNVTATGNYTELNTGDHKEGGKYSYMHYLTGLADATADQGVMSDVASGNFDKNTEGKSAQIAMVYTKGYSAKGGLYLKFGDAKGIDTKAYGDSIELLSQSKKLGNPDLMLENENGTASDKKAENFAENPYQLKNYLQVATGDWNGDGVDEVAVYIPEQNNSRIAVYALQRTEGGAYKKASNWSLAWTYYLKEDNVVSNMISMTSGDVDRDGIDDLSCTWGYYYGPTQNKGSKAVVMFGGKDKNILKRSQQFDISYGSSNIVRGSFIFGDIGTGEDSLILCGQADSDLKAGNTYTRYVAMYVWDGKKFSANMEKNFNLFERDKDGNLVNSKMSGHGDKDSEVFYSLPLCPANTAIINKGIKAEGGNKLYFDSLVFSYTKNGLELEEAWDMAKFMPGNGKTEYVEYDGAAGDMTGLTGAGALMTVTQTLSSNSDNDAKYTETGNVQVPVYKMESYYKNWFYKLIKKKSYRMVFKGYETREGTTEIVQNYTKNTWGKTKMVIACPSESYSNVEDVNSSFSLCLANTDNDSSYMNYAGKHYFRYTDPKVLAVLASPPYFKDLLDRDDLSGNYAESTTSYASTTGSESGSTGGTTITVGSYVSFEQEISVFGVKIGQTEAEAVVTHGFTWETEKTSSLEQTVAYSATSGEDKVALYSIPMEIYQYESYIPDENGKYEKVITEVNLPHEACIKLLDLSEYETIAEDYSILPTIAESVLRHEIGDPSSYPSSTAGYNVIAQYNGTPASVGFTSKGGGDTITQEIAMSKSNSNSYSYVGNVEAKAGAGAGGVTVGVIAGFEGTGGTVHISTEGSSFSGELQAMPAEAKPYGYNMNWKIFCYKYKSAKMEFPVVSYLVTDVQQPASLPEDFDQDVAETTDDSVTLTWSYDKYVSGFQIYRYYEFPDGNGSYRLEYVPFSKGVKKGDKYEFSYTDKNLSPYTEYKYQIQTESTYNPKVSIYSEPISCRTKTKVGYPKMTVEGLVGEGKDAGKLAIYPDAEGKAIVNVADEKQYKSLSYQWQKLSNGEWKNLPAYKTKELTIANASAADKGTYRCRVNAIYFDTTAQKEFSISAYTPSLETVYTKRTPEAVMTVKAEKYGTNKDINGIHAEITLHSANHDNTTAPKGNVTFTVEGKDYENTKVEVLTPSTSTKSFDMGNGKTENKYYSDAILDLEGLADGTYTVKYYYSGDSVFKDKTQEIGQIVAIGSATGYVLNMKNAGDQTVTKYTYGDKIKPTLYTVKAGTSDTEVVNSAVTYKYKTSENSELKDFKSDAKLDAGKYTMYAYLAGKTEAVASAAFSVEKKILTVSAVAKDNVSDVTQTPPELKTDIEGVTAKDLGVEYKAYNSAGNETTLSNDDPGNYTIIPCFKANASAANEAARANYEIHFESAVYTVIGQIYKLSVTAEKYTDKDVSKNVGTAAISESGLTTGNYTKGTTVQLYASPDEGYEVEKWVVKTSGYDDETYSAESLKSEGKNPSRLNLSMKPGETNVSVFFRVKGTHLNIIKSEGGDVTCTSDNNFESGANVRRGAEFTFKATPKTGYSFDQWIISETGFNAVYKKGTAAEDGTNTIDVQVRTNDIGLKAVFVRDSYKVELDGNVTAYYYKENSDSTAEKEKIYITSGKSVKGDTEITVTPKTGYVAAEGAKITINGEPIDQNSSYTFNLTENTTIGLKTVRESYKVKASVKDDVGGKIVITADGKDIESDSDVEGGNKVVFKAIAERGYVFKHWVIGEDTSLTKDEYVIDELGKPVAVTAVFKENSKHTMTGTVSPASRGTMTYTLYDIYGNVVEENKEYSAAIKMYKGESVDISVKPAGGSMVEQWVLNDGKEKKTVSSSKTYPGGRITMNDSDIAIEAVMISSTSYNLYFNAADENDGSVIATSDGKELKTGDAVDGGSDVVFTAEPANGKMVDYWTVTKGIASVTPTEENTVKVKDDDGVLMVEPMYHIKEYTGHKTVRVYFKNIEQKTIAVNGSNASVKFTYVTPIKNGDTTEPAGTSVKARTGGTVKLVLAAKENHATSLDEVKAAFAGCSEKINAEYKDGKYAIVLKNITGEKSVNADGFIDKLVQVKTSGKNYTAGEIKSDKVADGAAAGQVRSGSDVEVKLTPKSGYQVDETKLQAWITDVKTKGVCTELEVPKAADGSVTAKIKGIKADVEIPDEVFVQVPTGGGGSGGGGAGGGSATPEEKPTEDKRITVEDTFDSEGKNITELSVKVEATKSDDGKSIELELGDELKKAVIEKAIEKKADSIVIRNDKLSDELEKASYAANVKLDADLVNEIINKTDSSLTVDTPVGSVRFDRKALKTVQNQIGDAKILKIQLKIESNDDYSHIVGENALVVSVKMFADSNRITDFGDGKVRIRLEIPKALADKNLIAVFIGENNSLERFEGEVVESKYYCFDVNHFSVYALADRETVDDYENSQGDISDVNKTKVKLTAKSLKKKVKLSWKLTGAKVDSYEIYRAKAKKGKYVKVRTVKKSGATGYTYLKKLKKGKTYFYKVRGVKTIDGQKYYTKWSNIAKAKNK